MPVSEKKFSKNAQIWINSKGTSKVFNKYSPYNLVRLTNGLNPNFRQQYIIVNGKLLNTYHARRVNKSELLNTFKVAANYPYLTTNKIKSAYSQGGMINTYKNLNNYKKQMKNFAGYQNTFNNFNTPGGLIIALLKPRAAPKKKAPKKKAPKKPAGRGC